VPREQLFGAIALNAIAMTLSLILGPVLAKAIGDHFGFEGAFWFQAALLFVGVGFLTRLEVPPHEVVHERRSVTVETKLAVRHVLDDHHLKTLFGLLLVASMTINPAVMVTLQAHVKDELGRTAGEAAIPFAFMGLGIAISSFVVLRKGDMRNKGAVFQRAMMCGTAITFLVGRSNSFTQVVVLAFFMGLAGGFFINMNQGLIQANTPQPMMGRVMGLYTLVTVGLLPFGALMLTFGVMFFLASKDPVKHRLLIDIGILRFALGALAHIISIVGPAPYATFWLVHLIIDVVLLILFIISRPKTVPAA